MEREVKERLASIIDNSADAIVTADLDGKVLSWNKGAEELYGYTAQEVIGRSILDLYPEELKKERQEWTKTLLKKGAIRNKRTRIYNRRGELVDIILTLSLLKDAGGAAIGTVGISKDVSREVELEEKLKERAQQLEEKTKEVESFLYAISHDLKSPIISIQGFAASLLEEYGSELGEEARFYLERINKNIELMDDLITDLLELSRIGRISQPFQEVELEELVNSICGELAHRNKNIKFVAGKLPRVRCEKNRIIQVFTNLIGNAVKYMAGQEKPVIEIGSADAGDAWKLYVRDNGLGIPAEYHDKLFQPFQRIPSESTRGVGGTGLGLAIVKKIVEHHKGRAWVESASGEGSTFYFTLPK